MFTKDQWHEIDTDKLSGATSKAYKAYVSANEEMKLQRAVLEDVLGDAVLEHIPDHLEARFAYRWGKVSVAAVERKAKTKGGGKISL